MNLNNKKIILTGSCGYLGKSIKSMALSFGADVIGLDKSKEADIVADISNERQVAEICSSIGPIDGLINNAAISIKGLCLDTDNFQKTFDINVIGTMNMIKLCKFNSNASVVNVSSIYGSFVPDFEIYNNDVQEFNNISYGISKSSIEYMTKYLSKLYGANIRVNSVSPGGIYLNHSQEFVSQYSKRVALKRMARPEEIAAPILFLLSDFASYITGQIIQVNGGFNI